MTIINIEQPTVQGRYALWHLGFRPFFLAAGVFAAMAMLLWTGMYHEGWTLLHPDYPALNWHSHEMIYAYSVAVIIGFLLTATKNWTGQQTLHGKPLSMLLGLWILARVLPFLTTVPLWGLAVIDTLFLTGAAIAIAHPIVQGRHWQHLAIIAKVALLVPANIIFYLGLLGYWPAGISVGLYLGFYTIVTLVFNMGRRVIPFFIEKGVGCPFEVRHFGWVDKGSLLLFLAFMIADIWAVTSHHTLASQLSAFLALLQVPLHSLRLWGWHHPNIWRKPLLWVLYVAYIGFIVGFFLKALSLFIPVSPFLALHAFAVGGITLMTVGMMTRVTLGHTGRNVFSPPAGLSLLFGLLLITALVRVFAVWVLPAQYSLWILIAQFTWIAAFTLFLWQYALILIKPRTDQRYG